MTKKLKLGVDDLYSGVAGVHDVDPVVQVDHEAAGLDETIIS